MSVEELRVDTEPIGGYSAYVFDSIGPNIRRLREAARMTQRGLAKAMGIENTRVSDWENGRFTPDLSNLVRLAKGLECSIDELIAGSDVDYDRIAGRRPDAPAGGAHLTPEQRELLEQWQAITPRARETVRSLLNDLTPTTRKARHRRTA